MGSELQPDRLVDIAAELEAASGRLGGGFGSCPAALPGAGVDVSAQIAQLLADERGARTALAEGIAALAGDLEHRAEIVLVADQRRR